MDGKTLAITLSHIPSDSNKNNTLKSLVSLVHTISWLNIIEILKFYSSDSSKKTAIEYLTYCQINEPVDNYLPAIIKNISSDSSTVSVLSTLTKNMSNITCDILYSCLKSISSDSSKVNAIQTLSPYVKTISETAFVNIIQNISSDSSKVNGLSILVSQINYNVQSTYVSNANILSNPCFYNIVNSISSDSSKVKAIGYITPRTFIDVKSTISILQNISSDSSTLSAIRTFIDCGLQINYDDIFSIINTCSSNSAKSNIVLAFNTFLDSIDDHDKYCQMLAKNIDDEDYYLKACEKLNLNDECVQKYLPPKKSSFIFVSGTNGTYTISGTNSIHISF